MTAYALRANDTRLTGGGIEVNGLMTTIHTGHMTATTADTLLTIYLRIDDGVAIEIGRCHEVGKFLAHQISQMSDCDFVICDNAFFLK